MVGSRSLLVVFVSAVLIVLSNTATEKKTAVNGQVSDQKLWTEVVKRDAGCDQVISILGRGVRDYLRETCDVMKPLATWCRSGGVTVLGNPMVHDLSLYQDTWAQLVVIRKGECSLVGYSTFVGGEVTKHRGQITLEECQRVKRIMTRVWRGQDKKNRDKIMLVDQRLEINVKERVQEDGTCVMEVEVVGGGVEETFKEPCLRGQIDSMTRAELALFGDVDQFSFCLFSDTRGDLVVIRGGHCVELVYSTTRRVTTGRPSLPPMTEGQCGQLKRRIVTLVEQERASWTNKAGKVIETRMEESSNVRSNRASPPRGSAITRLFRKVTHSSLIKQIKDAFVW